MSRRPYIITVAILLAFLAGFLIGRRNSTTERASALAYPPSVAGAITTPLAQPLPPTAALPDARAPLAGLSHDQVKQRTLLALREPDRFLRAKAWMDILAGMTKENGAAVAAGLMERYRSGGNTKEEGEQLQIREGQLFGLGAISKLPAEPNGNVDWATKNAIRGWASADPISTKAWIDSLEQGSAQSAMHDCWLEGLARSTPDIIASVFHDLPSKSQRTLLGGLMTGIYDQGGMNGLRDWFSENQTKLDSSVLSSALTTIVQRMAQVEGQSEGTVAFLQAQVKTPFFSPKAFEAFADGSAATDPGRCLEVLQNLAVASPDLQSQLERQIARTVDLSTAKSLNTLGTWLSQHPDHPLYDMTVLHFARRTHQDDPEAALRWADTIRDAVLREQLKQKLSKP
jgi:hypothetical protein